MAYSLFRTGSVTTSKKHHQHNNSNGSSHKDTKLNPNHRMMNGQHSRRNTIHPRARDSVHSIGSSDRSSSISDELFLPSTPILEDHTSLMDASMESLTSFDIDERIGSAWPVKCRFVVREIVQTEITYVQSLGEIINGYLKPLYSQLLNSGESPNFIKTVFCNIIKIHQTHLELMEYFKDTCMSPVEFASSFLKVDFLNLYTVYCTSYAQGNECLERSLADNPELREFIEDCQHKVGHSLPLSSQLIKPVQRILKYRLLLEELNKHFDADHKTLSSALEKMSAVAEEINTSFTKQKRMPKSIPSVVAKKRTNQVRDLQKSRPTKGRKSNTPSPVHSKLQHRCTSETQLHVPESNHSGSLVNGRALGASAYCVGSNGPPGGGSWTMGRLPSDHKSSTDEDGRERDSTRTSSGTATAKSTNEALPSVSRLRSYFENLVKEEEEIRRKSFGNNLGNLKRAASLADTRRDPESGKILDSPLSPTSLSPKPQRRRSSLDFKFQFGGGRHVARKGRERSLSPSPDKSQQQRRSSVEDDIKRHIAEVRARKFQNAQRTMV